MVDELHKKKKKERKRGNCDAFDDSTRCYPDTDDEQVLRFVSDPHSLTTPPRARRIGGWDRSVCRFVIIRPYLFIGVISSPQETPLARGGGKCLGGVSGKF